MQPTWGSGVAPPRSLDHVAVPSSAGRRQRQWRACSGRRGGRGLRWRTVAVTVAMKEAKGGRSTATLRGEGPHRSCLRARGEAAHSAGRFTLRADSLGGLTAPPKIPGRHSEPVAAACTVPLNATCNRGLVGPYQDCCVGSLSAARRSPGVTRSLLQPKGRWWTVPLKRRRAGRQTIWFVIATTLQRRPPPTVPSRVSPSMGPA